MSVVRKNLRLKNFNYSSANQYFITICVDHFRSLLGQIRNGIMGFSEIGNIAYMYLQEIPVLRPNVVLDEYAIMPNHVHCILEITKSCGKDLTKGSRFGRVTPNSISIIINQYKGAVKKWANRNGFADFKWQGRFHDHVIRNTEEYERIRDYIRNNSRNWTADRFYRS